MEEALLFPAAATKGTSPIEQEKEKDRTCPRCGKVLATRVALHKHLNKVFLCDRKGERRHKDEMRQLNGAYHCNKCGKNFTSAAGLRYHWAKVTPCDSPQQQQKKVSAKKKDKNQKRFLKCPKCQATFSSSQNLRLHLSRLNPCDNSEPKQHDPGNKTCPKCNTTFTSAQSLRLHLTRLIPCDAEQPPGAEMEWQICHKCHKKFASERSLNIHLSQRECNEKPTSSQSHRMKRKASKTLDLSRPNKATPAEVSLDEYLKKTTRRSKESEAPAQSKKEQHHTKEAPLAIRATSADPQQESDHSEKVAASNGTSKRKRGAEDGREDMSPLGEANKRVCSDPKALAELAARVTKTDSSTQTEASDEQNIKHGGNILTDGCCCRECVRKWTRKMMNRMSRMNDEVTSLRKQVKLRGSVSSDVSKAKSSTSDVGIVSSPTVKKESVNVSVSADTPSHYASTIVNKPKVGTSTSGPTATSLLPKDPVKLSLTEKYNHLNDQIITNERALEDSAAYLKEISGHDEASTSELRSQLDELRIYIDVEKGKRDEVVACIIAQRWTAKRNEFRLLLENMAVKSKPYAEKAFHEECAEIASQLEEKNKVLAKLGGLIGAVGLNAGNLSSSGIGIPKYAVEKTAKSFLERQRDDVFMCLLRSSPRIYLLTKEKLVETKKLRD